MESSLLNGMCRCCASEGVFKDVKTAYTWMGEEEVYADMLKQCFDICLSTSEQGDDGGICEVCITQLRNAANFKKQVLTTEEQFKKHALSKLFKPSIIKLEVSPEDDNDSDDNALSGDDGYSGPEFEVPIKTEVDDPKPKKRAAASKASTSRAKKAKADNGETSTKREQRTTNKEITPNAAETLEKEQKRPKRGSENLKLILENSNASLIRSKDSDGYGCNFCPKKFTEPDKLKTHSLEEHSNIQSLRMPKPFEYIIKLDITDLKCKICEEKFKKLDDFVTHLKEKHSKKITSDIKDIIPFKFDTEELRCAICGTEYSTFKILQEHMHNHFRNYICDVCSAGFITNRLLVRHKSRHGKGEFKCGHCEKTFACDQKRRDHEQRMHLGLKKRNKCKLCDEKFDDYWTKMHHMVQKHGAPPISLKCTACDRTFTNRRSLARHVKKDHLMEREHVCSICDMQFFLKHYLDEHMRVHTGVKKFQCHVCTKHYASKKSLRQHLRSHADDRKFACSVCGLAFVQRSTLKSHMRAKHGE
ncbi:uncharacterized protein LOC142985169 isoform X11 [Anticarsia gemmatalis]|uniref:uncharacterized protein LOC142985169 isoform X11 n=1 Tax=Anticarsia gemmatalis TaxID=129554 RepID=UPI003F75B426